MRIKSYLLFSAAILVAPVLSVSAAAAYTAGDPVPVEFGSDPGAAHPKHVYDEPKADDILKEVAAGEITRHDVLRESETEAAKREKSAAATNQDSGQFDYGYASNEIELRGKKADGEPVVLVSEADEKTAKAKMVTVSAPAKANPYTQDPLYKISSQQGEIKAKPVGYQASAGGTIAIVQPGETVYAIGRKYGVHPNDIIALNGLSAPYRLEIGQQLRIPVAARRAEIPAPQPTPQPIKQVEYRAAPKIETPKTETPKIETMAVTAPANTLYIIRKGDTLYSLSRRSGLSVGKLAQANNIAPPYALSIGQQIIIPGGIRAGEEAIIATAPKPIPSQETGNRNTYIDPDAQSGKWQKPRAEAATPQPAPTKAVAYPSTELDKKALGASRFVWPLQGQIVMSFGLDAEGRRNDGINIAAPVGAPIRSVADGEIVYRGSDLDGYGNLLLIKHEDGWVSAYAHADAMLVRKGEKVKRGQIIAKVGTTGAVSQPQLHFELRHNLKPTDPLAALEGRNELALQKVNMAN
jgi:murein DD-endopeptidase MepM/ murein hydrolase activator NlpD